MKTRHVNIAIKEDDMNKIKILEGKLGSTLDNIINTSLSRYFMKFKMPIGYRQISSKYKNLENKPCNTYSVLLNSTSNNIYNIMINKLNLNKNGLRSELIHNALEEYSKIMIGEV